MKFILTLLLSCGFLAVQAQNVDSATPQATTAGEPTIQELSSEIESLKYELNEQKKKSTKWDKVLSKLPKLSAYIQVGFDWREDVTTNFFLKRARLSLSGDITSRLDYKLQLEFASMQVRDAFIKYRPLNGLNFQVGMFKIPFSLMNTNCPPPTYEFIESPMGTSKLLGGNDLCGMKATGRDLGAQVYGGFWEKDGFSVINYNFGVFNGEGISIKDHNSSKDVVARLTFIPVKGLQISGSCHWGEYGDKYLLRKRYSGGMFYDSERVRVRGEWIGGWTGDLYSSSWYVSGGYFVTKKLLVSGRYDTFLLDATTSLSRQTNYSASLMWYPVKNFNCQLNYTYEDFSAHDQSNHNVIGMMLTAMF